MCSWKIGGTRYTDDPAPMLGVYFNGQEIPLGILRKAIGLRGRGYSVEFCIEHFREVYDVEIPLEHLAEAMAQWSRGLQVPQARYFPGGDGIGARDENPAFTQPPPFDNGNQSSSLSGSGGADDNDQLSTSTAPPVSPISPGAFDITLRPSATAGDSGSQYSVETPEAEMTHYYDESTAHGFGDGTERVATDDIGDRNYEPSENEISTEGGTDD